MDITDQVAVFHLSPQGRNALRGLVPSGASFEAFVFAMDDLGAWLLLGRRSIEQGAAAVPVTLLKWEYVSAVALELKLGAEGSAGVEGS